MRQRMIPGPRSLFKNRVRLLLQKTYRQKKRSTVGDTVLEDEEDGENVDADMDVVVVVAEEGVVLMEIVSTVVVRDITLETVGRKAGAHM